MPPIHMADRGAPAPFLQRPQGLHAPVILDAQLAHQRQRDFRWPDRRASRPARCDAPRRCGRNRTSATTSACTVLRDSGCAPPGASGQGRIRPRPAARGFAQRDGHQAFVVLRVVAQPLAAPAAPPSPGAACAASAANSARTDRRSPGYSRSSPMSSSSASAYSLRSVSMRGQQLARGRVFGVDDQHLAHRLFGGFRFRRPAIRPARCGYSRSGSCGYCVSACGEHAARVGEAAALDEIERLLGVDGGTRGLVVHGLNDA